MHSLPVSAFEGFEIIIACDLDRLDAPICPPGISGPSFHTRCLASKRALILLSKRDHSHSAKLGLYVKATSAGVPGSLSVSRR